MTVQIPPGYAMASIEYWLQGYTRPAVTTWGLDVSANMYDPDTMARGFHDIYAGAMQPRTDSNVTLRNARIVIGQDGPDPVIGISNQFTAGTSSRESTPPALALMVNTPTGLGGRRNRGRKYIPWAVGEGSVDERGVVENSAVNTSQLALDQFKDDLEDNDWYLVVLHGAGSSPIPPPTPISRLLVNPIIRTQKQRQARF